MNNILKFEIATCLTKERKDNYNNSEGKKLFIILSYKHFSEVMGNVTDHSVLLNSQSRLHDNYYVHTYRLEV